MHRITISVRVTLLGVFAASLFTISMFGQSSVANPALSREGFGAGSRIYGNTRPNGPAATMSSTGQFIPGSYQVGPVVQPTTTTYEAEESVALDSSNPSFVLAGISDFSIPRYGYIGNTTKYAWSNDGGKTWSESFVQLDQSSNQAPITGDGITWQRMSDPVVAVDSISHIAYLLDLYFDMFNNANGAYVSSSPIKKGNVQFTAVATRPVAVNTDPNTRFFEDKPWIAVDNTNKSKTSGNVYVAWTHYPDAITYGPFGGEIRVAISSDHAATFKPAVIVSPASQLNAVQGPQVAVDSAGRVLVSWTYCLQYTYPVPGQYNAKCDQSQIWGAASTNGGASFSTPVPISPVMNDLDGSGFQSHYRKWSAPAMAVDPSGWIAIVYVDQPGANSATEYIACPPAFSQPCSAPKVISDVAMGQRVFPAVAIDNLGIVHVSWFDGRNAPDTPYSSQLDLYATFASSVRKPFHANSRVSSSTIDFDYANLGSIAHFIGDYSGIAAGQGVAHPVWTDGYLQTSTLTFVP